MKCIIVLLSLIFYSTAKDFQNVTQLMTSGSRDYAVNYTNLADESVLDAFSCLDKAYILHPDQTDARLRSFSGLFGNLHKVDRGWSVAQGCGNLYVPQWVNYLSFKVTEGSSRPSYFITIYN